MSSPRDRLRELVGEGVRTMAKDRIAVYNTVAVRDTPLIDGGDYYPEHKRDLCHAVADTVTATDGVVMVGGGRGVAAVWAARQGATVTVYEAAAEMVSTLRETAELNGVTDQIDVRHAVVGPAHDVYGDIAEATTVDPATLTGDVLVLDCEGAELDILPVDGFRTSIVETHPRYDAPTDVVLDCLGEGTVVAADAVDGDVVVV